MLEQFTNTYLLGDDAIDIREPRHGCETQQMRSNIMTKVTKLVNRTHRYLTPVDSKLTALWYNGTQTRGGRSNPKLF